MLVLTRIVATVTLVVALGAGAAGAGSAPSARPALCTHTRIARGSAAVWVTPCVEPHA